MYNEFLTLLIYRYIKKFDVCFIDEASQCTEPWTLVPLQYNVTSMILVGDSNQLSPVVLSQVFIYLMSLRKIPRKQKIFNKFLISKFNLKIFHFIYVRCVVITI